MEDEATSRQKKRKWVQHPVKKEPEAAPEGSAPPVAAQDSVVQHAPKKQKLDQTQAQAPVPAPSST